MQPFEESIISITKKNITLELLPPLKETPSLKTGAVVREVVFRTKSTTVPVPLLKIPGCFILGGKLEWLKNFKFLETYNQAEGIIIISMPQKAADFEVKDEQTTLYKIKTLGIYENFQDSGNYKIVQCNIGKNVRYSMCGVKIQKVLNIAKSKKLWSATLIVQGYASKGTTSTGLKYTSLKYRIIDINLTNKGNL